MAFIKEEINKMMLDNLEQKDKEILAVEITLHARAPYYNQIYYETFGLTGRDGDDLVKNIFALINNKAER